MGNFLIGRLLRWIGARLDGKKTVVGGVGLILCGLAGLLGHMFPDQGLPQQDIESALTTVAAGFAALGLGGKLEKTKNEITAGRGPAGQAADDH